nr:unnamed protein product [Callosobruchus analis]
MPGLRCTQKRCGDLLMVGLRLIYHQPDHLHNFQQDVPSSVY